RKVYEGLLQRFRRSLVEPLRNVPDDDPWLRRDDGVHHRSCANVRSSRRKTNCPSTSSTAMITQPPATYQPMSGGHPSRADSGTAGSQKEWWKNSTAMVTGLVM